MRPILAGGHTGKSDAKSCLTFKVAYNPPPARMRTMAIQLASAFDEDNDGSLSTTEMQRLSYVTEAYTTAPRQLSRAQAAHVRSQHELYYFIGSTETKTREITPSLKLPMTR